MPDFGRIDRCPDFVRDYVGRAAGNDCNRRRGVAYGSYGLSNRAVSTDRDNDICTSRLVLQLAKAKRRWARFNDAPVHGGGSRCLELLKQARCAAPRYRIDDDQCS